MASRATTDSLKITKDILHQIKSVTGRSITDARREKLERLLSQLSNLRQVLPTNLQPRVSQWIKGDGSVADAPPSVAKIAAAASASACFATSSTSTETGSCISASGISMASVPPRELAAPSLPCGGTTIATTKDPSLHDKVCLPPPYTDSFSASLTSPLISKQDIDTMIACLNYSISLSPAMTLDSLAPPTYLFGLNITDSYIMQLNNTIVKLLIKIGESGREKQLNLPNIYLSFLSELGTQDTKEKNKRSVEFFAYLFILTGKLDLGTDPILSLGFYASSKGEIDTLLTPEKKRFLDAGAAVPSKVAKTLLRRDSAIDEQYLKNAFDKGTLAGQHLLEGTSSNFTSGFTLIDFWLAQIIITNKPPPLFTEKSSKKTLIARIRDARYLAFLPREARVYALIQMESYARSIITAETNLFDIPKRYSDVLSFFCPTIERIVRKLDAIDKEVSNPEKKRSIQFSLVKENYEELLHAQTQFSIYHQQILLALEQSVITARLMAYTVLFKEDPDKEADSILTKGIRESIEDYMKTHPDPELSRLDDINKCVIEKYLEIAEKRQTALNAFRILFDQLKKTMETIKAQYSPDFDKLRELYEKGMIDMGGDEGLIPVFHIPKVLTAAAETSSTTDYMLTEKSSPLPAEATEDLPKRDLCGPYFYLKLLEIYPLEAFTNPEAARAYTTALQYIESLYNLMILQKRGPIEGNSLGHLQMDIGLAAFYALEQLLTAIVLEKEKKPPEGGAGSGDERNSYLFKTLRHSLTNRLIKARLPASSEVLAVLEETEGMDIAIRELEKRYYIPPLLKNTSSLLYQTEKTSKILPDEVSKNLAYGNRVVHAFIELLSIVSPNPLASRINLSPYFTNIQEVPKLKRTEDGCPRDPLPADAKKATSEDLVLSPVDALKTAMNSALNNSNDYLQSQLRWIMIEHNLHRYRYLVSCISIPTNLPLFPFYVNQGRFTLRVIIEEFLCAAHESKIGAINQQELFHRVSILADRLKLSNLSDQERHFLADTPNARNEARYGPKVKAHLLLMTTSELMSSAFEKAEPGSEGAGDEYQVALRPRYERMRKSLEKEFEIVNSLCLKIAKQCFPDLAEKE